MLVNEILGRLTRYNNIEIDVNLGLDWLNDFQADVALEAGPVSERKYANILGGIEYDLPSNFISLISAKKEDGELITSSSLSITRGVANSKIIFPSDERLITLSYIQDPPTLTQSSDPLTVHPRMQTIATMYLISQYYDMEAEGDPEESNFAEKQYQRYLFRKNQISAEIMNSYHGPIKTIDVLPNRLKPRAREDF